MSQLRVFQNVNKRRKPYGYGSLLLFFLLFPYMITVLLGNGRRQEEETEILMLMEQLEEGEYTVINETDVGRESIPLEMYVADRLMRTMEEDYEQEALKAQAVLIRAELIPEEGMSIVISDEDYGKAKIGEKYLMAAAQTRGVYPEYDGKPVYGAYCRVSNGRTRPASEVLQTGEYPYLAGAVCEKDFLCGEYAKTLFFGKKEFEAAFALLDEAEISLEAAKKAREEGRYETKENMDMIRDSAGYVLFLRYRGKWVSGEAMRYALNLPSASFETEEEEAEIRFLCKGAGHGLGMSQFAANEMAAEGKDYIEILKYFFEGITLTKTE